MMSRRRNDQQGHMIGELFTFVLFAAFLLLSLLIVVIGVDGYRRVVNASDSVGSIRTSLGYVSGKLRSDAGTDGIRLESYDGLEALVLTEVYDGDTYETVIYHQNGALFEDYRNADDLEFDPEQGVQLVDIETFQMAQEDGMLVFTAAASDGRAQTLHIAPRVGQEVSNP